nr:TRAP transporter fused permease subunit [uncultured Roseovarius sp.]
MSSHPTVERRKNEAIDKLLFPVSLIAALYHLIMAVYPLVDTIPHRIIHVLLITIIVSLAVIKAAGKNSGSKVARLRTMLAWLCVAGVLISFSYFLFNSERLEIAQPYINGADIWIMGIAATVVLILTALVWGPVISVLVCIGIAYFVFGHELGGIFNHPEYDMDFIMSYLGASLTQGIFGPITTVSADAIFLLILFGALFQTTGVLALFMEFGKIVGNHLRGGAAYSAVVGSALMGTVTGASVANVALTGRITIPTMKRTGFKPEQAASVEAVASAGGQIAPPIMGSAAFIMASLMEVPYSTIMTIAIIPAILYFLGAGIGVYFMVRSSELNPPKEVVSVRIILTHSVSFFVPMGVLIALLSAQYSPGYAAFWAIVTLMVVAQVVPATRSNLRNWLAAFGEGAQLAAQIAIVLVAVGMVSQSVITTNLAMKLTFSVTNLVGQEVLPVLLISMVIAILLGMELPTPVAYILMFVTVVPMMIDVGIDPFAANFFAFYFAILSTLTPPIALSVLTASRMAGANFFRTSGHALRLSFIGYVLPFGFALNPALLGSPESMGQAVASISTIILVIVVGNAAMYGYFVRHLGVLERLLAGAAATAGLGYVMTQTSVWLAVFAVLTVAAFIRPALNQGSASSTKHLHKKAEQ